MLDPQGFAAVVEDVGDITDEQKALWGQRKAAAQRTVANHATNVEDAIELMRMLGIHPGQDDPVLSSMLGNSTKDGFPR